MKLRYPSARGAYSVLTFIPELSCHAREAVAELMLDAADQLSFTPRILIGIPIGLVAGGVLLSARVDLAIIEFLRPEREDFPGIKRPR